MNNIRKGFTLIELLVVVLIIGILASIAIPQYFKVVEKSRLAEAMSVISSIKSAEERFLARGGTYTNATSALDITYPGMSGSNITTKFYTATISGATDCAGVGPCYVITVVRHTASATVAARYGLYTLTCNIPVTPSVTGSSVLVNDELIN